MSYPEFLEWVEYYRREPFGEFREDTRHAIRSALLANIHRRPHSRAFEIDEFIPRFAGQREDRIAVFREALKQKAKEQQTDGS